MIKVGITGQSGFVGRHLFKTLGENNTIYERVLFEDRFFDDMNLMRNFVKECDVIVHLAALVRSHEVGAVFNINMRLVNTLIEAMELERVHPSILFPSSIQENTDTEYGRCKRDGDEMFKKWAEKHNTGYCKMVFPNLFGPGATPNYHSFIATFCYKLTHNEQPTVLVDNTVSLIYIEHLMRGLLVLINNVYDKKNSIIKQFDPMYEIKVTELLAILKRFKSELIESKSQPVVHNQLEEDLLETFLSYSDYKI